MFVFVDFLVTVDIIKDCLPQVTELSFWYYMMETISYHLIKVSFNEGQAQIMWMKQLL